MKLKSLASTIALAIVVSGAATLGASGAVAAQTKQKSAAQKKNGQKIGMKKAREIALAKASGKVESGEFEVENGKSVYSFDIRNQKGTITEVQVEAFTGEVVSVEEENAQAEAAEKKAEKAEKAQKREKRKN